jgi:hypothetical protein
LAAYPLLNNHLSLFAILVALGLRSLSGGAFLAVARDSIAHLHLTQHFFNNDLGRDLRIR